MNINVVEKLLYLWEIRRQKLNYNFEVLHVKAVCKN